MALITEFETYLQSYFDIGSAECKLIARSFKAETIKKGEFFLRSGAVSDRLGFIQDGILRIYVQLPGREVTQWISTQASFVTDFSGFFYRNPSRHNIQALTDVQLLTIDYTEYQALGKRLPAWNDFEKQFVGKCFVFMESRVFNLISLPAEERYQWFFEQNHKLFNQVPLQYIASMLGMTPETLSRIRKKQTF